MRMELRRSPRAVDGPAGGGMKGSDLGFRIPGGGNVGVIKRGAARGLRNCAVAISAGTELECDPQMLGHRG